jgi:hypothetical protein
MEAIYLFSMNQNVYGLLWFVSNALIGAVGLLSLGFGIVLFFSSLIKFRIIKSLFGILIFAAGFGLLNLCDYLMTQLRNSII